LSTPIPSPVVHTTTTAEQLGDCQVYNLPSPQQMSPTPQLSIDQSDKETIHTALLAHIEMLESENASLWLREDISELRISA